MLTSKQLTNIAEMGAKMEKEAGTVPMASRPNYGDEYKKIVNYLREGVLAYNDIKKGLIIYYNDIEAYGYLIVSESRNRVDNHCERCKSKKVRWVSFAGNEDVSVHLVSEIGTEKFKRYENNLEDILGEGVEVLEIIESPNG